MIKGHIVIAIKRQGIRMLFGAFFVGEAAQVSIKHWFTED